MYKLTTVRNITNAGGVETVALFDNFYDLQDHLDTLTADMNDANKEAFLYNASVENLGDL